MNVLTPHTIMTGDDGRDLPHLRVTLRGGDNYPRCNDQMTRTTYMLAFDHNALRYEVTFTKQHGDYTPVGRAKAKGSPTDKWLVEVRRYDEGDEHLMFSSVADLNSYLDEWAADTLPQIIDHEFMSDLMLFATAEKLPADVQAKYDRRESELRQAFRDGLAYDTCQLLHDRVQTTIDKFKAVLQIVSL